MKKQERNSTKNSELLINKKELSIVVALFLCAKLHVLMVLLWYFTLYNKVCLWYNVYIEHRIMLLI